MIEAFGTSCDGQPFEYPLGIVPDDTTVYVIPIPNASNIQTLSLNVSVGNLFVGIVDFPEFTPPQCGSDPDPIPGCTDSHAPNFDPEATEDDGSCECYTEVGEPILASSFAGTDANDVWIVYVEAWFPFISQHVQCSAVYHTDSGIDYPMSAFGPTFFESEQEFLGEWYVADGGFTVEFPDAEELGCEHLSLIHI